MSSLLINTSWVIFATGVSKILGICAQIILGFYLNIESFGIYAFALGLTTLFIWLKNGAITQLIIRKSLNSKFNQEEYLNYSQVFNIFSSIGLTILSFYFFGTSTFLIILSFALYQLFSNQYLLIRIQYTKENNYKKLAIFEVFQSLTRNLILIASALIFQNELSFVISLLAVTLYDIIFSYVSRLPIILIPKKIKLYRIKRIFIQGKWLLVGALASTFIMQGSFAIIGILTSKNILGVYYFAFQMIAIISILVGEAIRKVLMPSFSRIKSNKLRIEKLVAIIKVSIIILVPISVHSALGIEPILKIIWSEKWTDAIIPGEIMASIIFLPILVIICYSFLEANALWKKRNLLQLSDALMVLISAIIGSLSGSLIYITLVIVLGKVSSGIIQMIYIFKLFSIPLKSILKILLSTILINIFLIVLILLVTNYFSFNNYERILLIIFSFSIYITSYFIIKNKNNLKKGII